MSSVPKLKPCPFCGGDGVWVAFENENASAIECEKCGAGSAKVFHLKEDGRPHLASMWNDRAGEAAARQRERARAAEIIKGLLDLATCDDEERLLLDDAQVAKDITAARRYVEEAEKP